MYGKFLAIALICCAAPTAAQRPDTVFVHDTVVVVQRVVEQVVVQQVGWPRVELNPYYQRYYPMSPYRRLPWSVDVNPIIVIGAPGWPRILPGIPRIPQIYRAPQPRSPERVRPAQPAPPSTPARPPRRP